MVDVVYIHPGASHGIYGPLGETLTAMEPPLWPRILATFALERDLEAAIIDQEAEGLDAAGVATRCDALDPQLVVVCAHGHQPSASTQQMAGARLVLEALPHHRTLLTGNHPSALPEQTAREEPVTFVCDGEGPLTVEALLVGERLENVPGLVWQDRLGIHRNARAPLLPMSALGGEGAWHLLPMGAYRAHNWQCLDGSPRQPYASVHTSLGCSFSCHFCLSGDTPVNTIYGDIPIERLVEEGVEEIPVFTLDPETLDGKVSTAKNIRCYGSKEMVRVTFGDGTHIDCTPDHKFLQFKWGNGKSESKQWACEAQDLKPGAHVRALRFSNPIGYPTASWKKNARKGVHRMVAEWSLGRPLREGEVVHHIDHNKLNWLPDNLEVFSSQKDHLSEHPELAERMRLNNPAKNMTPEWREKIRKSLTGLKRSSESIERYRAASFIREAKTPGKVWWTEPDGSMHLSVSPRDPNAARGMPVGMKWWTKPDGTTYQAITQRNQEDRRGRAGFNAHINHRIVSVEPLEGLHKVYCLDVPETGWFYANNVLVKNCMINIFQHKSAHRRREPAAVVAEMQHLYDEYGVRTFKLTDELFVLNRAHHREVCRLITASGMRDLNIWCYARTDTVRPEDLPLLRAAGVRWLALGVEAAHPGIRADAGKRLGGSVSDTVQMIRDAGISVIANYIVGLPGETEETADMTYQLAASLNTEFMNVYCSMAYPGSALYDQAVAAGAVLPAEWRGYSQHNRYSHPLATAALTSADLLRLRDKFFDDYFRRPEYEAMISDKFGPQAVGAIRKMTSYRLERELLGAS